MAPRIRSGRRGFTFVELMVVVAILALLLGMAIPQYVQTMRASREAVLKSNLLTIRTQIQHYICDQQREPQSLDDLVRAGYLYEIPMDPMTRERTWRTVPEDPQLAVSQNEPGIANVRSLSDRRAPDGSAYAEW